MIKKLLFTTLLAGTLSTSALAASHSISNGSVEPLSDTQLQSANSKFATTPFDANEYLDNVQRRIGKKWKPPNLTESTVYKALFVLNKKGKVVRVSTLQASPFKDYDKSCKKAIKRAAPYGKLPQPITINFTFTFTAE